MSNTIDQGDVIAKMYDSMSKVYDKPTWCDCVAGAMCGICRHTGGTDL